jgi:hypothetical protein
LKQNNKKSKGLVIPFFNTNVKHKQVIWSLSDVVKFKIAPRKHSDPDSDPKGRN